MKSLITIFIWLVIAFPVTRPTPASATPFSAKRVPASAEGIIHIDMDKLRASSICKSGKIAEVTKHCGASSKVSFVKVLKDGLHKADMEEIALKVLHTARSITVVVFGDDEAAVLVELPEIAKMLPLVQTSEDVKTVVRDGITLYKIDGDAVAALHGDTLILGEDEKVVLSSAKVLAGKRKPLSGERLKGLTTGGKGILVAAGFDGALMKVIKDKAASKSLKADIRSVLFFAGEEKGKMFARIEARTGSSETANKLLAIATGLRAMLALSGDDPEIQSLLQGLTMDATGDVLKARIEVSSKMLLDLVEEIAD